MHKIQLNTIHLENNNLMTFTEKTMLTSNHLVYIFSIYTIWETTITQLLTKPTHREQTNNPHYGFNPTDSMLLNQMDRDRVYQNSIQWAGRKIVLIVMVHISDALSVKASTTLHKISRKQRAKTPSSQKKLLSLREIMTIRPN